MAITVVMQQPQPPQPAQAPEAPTRIVVQPPPTRQEIRQQIEEQVQIAREAARIAREQGRIETVQIDREPITIAPMPFPPNAIPREAIPLSIILLLTLAVLVIGYPIARAFARRIDRRTAAPQLDPGVASQLQRIENAVEAMAIEVERISEAQRYMARLESERGRESALRAGER